MVYEGGDKEFVETDQVNPKTIYAKSKLEAEKYILENWKKSTILRLGPVYGPDLPGSLFFFF